MNRPLPAPELEETIETALAELDLSVTEAKLHNDPLRLPLTALASFLRAQRQLHTSVADTIETAASRQPPAALTDQHIDDIGRRLLGSCQAWSRGLVKASVWRSWAALAAIGLVIAGAGFGAGWLCRGPAQIVAGITGGTPKCDDQQDGSRLCWIPVFERAPHSAGTRP